MAWQDGAGAVRAIVVGASRSSAPGGRGHPTLRSGRRRRPAAEIAFVASLADLVGFAMDRAERDQVMEALKQLNRRLQFIERRLNDLSEQLPGAIFQSSLHPDGVEQLDYMSVDCEDLWAISSAQLKIDMSSLWAMIDPEDAPSMQASVAYSAETLTPWSQRWRNVTPSGAPGNGCTGAGGRLGWPTGRCSGTASFATSPSGCSAKRNWPRRDVRRRRPNKDWSTRSRAAGRLRDL